MGGPPVIYRILGELMVGPDGNPAPLPTGHALKVLAGLLLNVNRQVSQAELLRATWGDAEIRTATDQLYKCVSSVRRLLTTVGRPDDLNTRRGIGYEVRIDRDEDMDSLLFVRLALRADAARARRDTDAEIEYRWQALNLWRGPRPMANVPDHGWEQAAHDLQRRRQRVAVRLFELEMGRGHHDAILDQLALLTDCHPTDQRLHEQRLISLYRSGHVAEAVQVYERYAAALEDETGRRPDRAIRDLAYAISQADEETIARAEAAIASTGGEAAAPNAPAVPVPRQMPPAPVDLVGRDDLVAEMTWLLETPRSTATPMVIWGAGGMGKTALMLYVAHRVAEGYPGGQLYAELRATNGPVADTGGVLAEFLRGFGVSRVPDTREERLALYRTLTADRRVLVLLDDAADEDQIRDLIPANPECAVVVTTRRHRLPDLDGVHHVPPLGALTPAAGADLFRRLVARSGIDLRADGAAVERVVALCAGLPLALRIAAAQRVRDHPRTTAELADHLTQHGLDAFTYGLRDVARSIGASVDRLSPSAKHLFLGLAVSRLPGFGQWTAAALLADSTADPAEALSQLAGYSIIEPTGSRYRLHDLTREYAQRRAQRESSPDQRRALLHRVHAALLGLTRRAHRGLVGGDYDVVHADDATVDSDAPGLALAELDASPQGWFETERLNIRAAVDHCAELGFTGLAWDLAFSTHEFYTRRDYHDDWHHTHTTALRACREAGDRRGEAVMMVGLGQPALVASRRSGDRSTLADIERAIEVLGELDDHHATAIAQRTLANALRRAGQLARPLELFLQALTGYEASGDRLGRWQVLRYIGHTYLDAGDHAAALMYLERARQAATELADPHVSAQTSYWVAQAHLAAGDLERAEAEFADVLAAFPEPSGPGHARAIHGLGDVALRRGDLASAAAKFDLAARLAREADGGLEGRVHLSIAGLRARWDDPAGEIAALEHAVGCFAGADAPFQQAHALAELGRAEARRNNTTGAAAAWDRVRRLYAAMDLPPADRIHREPATA
jgi:DNA-binding SARP family transcriptional activator/tetratricopeptide (TPR) repeat protein